MKKIKLLLFLIALAPMSSVFAQTFEITPSYGYQFGTKLYYGQNYIAINDSDQFGVTAGMYVRPNVVAELSYFNHSTQLDIKDRIYSPNRSRLADLNMDWFFLGATSYLGRNEKIKPFFGGGLGFVVASPKNENRDIIRYDMENDTRFSFFVKGGVNIMLTDAIGINLQGNLFTPVEWGGFYLGGGTGGFSGGVSTQSTIVLGGFSGGLVFKFGA
ncbi:outer membrane beta-barrel protein [Tamlana sp. I1]|uniref:outer membrane beta-barrel protein n=1 Tax=Tamlana sp. I1 TaxID=2762061 RepID=UPI0018903306|nr:outer membrane beta-barrel protein [Tamlana sp. I1]